MCLPPHPLPPRVGLREGRPDSHVSPPHSCVFEPEGNACSLTDSTAEEHVLALVEHAADEARDRISRLVPGGKVAPPRGGCPLPGAGLSVRPSVSGRRECLAGALGG